MRRSVSGYTLISMMVGLLIAIIVILSMLSLNATLIKVATDSTRQVASERQSASSMITAQEELQQAGFGVNADVGRDIVLLKNAHLLDGKLDGTTIDISSGGGSGNALLWGYNPTGASAKVDASAYRCTGLLLTDHGMLRLRPVACGAASAWSQLKWQTDTLAGVDATGASAHFTAGQMNCWPFGHSSAVKGLLVSYYASASPDSATPAAASTSSATASSTAHPLFSVCLSNFGG